MKQPKMIYEGGQGEIIEKKSRFIGSVYAVESEEEAISIIETVKKKYWDARHNCHAFIIGNNQEIKRYSDDGEPSGTAGKPMLDILESEGLTNCLVIVTRYFGGVLLGTGGLVRAYQQAVKAGLACSKVALKEKGVTFSVETDYNGIGKIQYIIGSNNENAYILDSIYTEKVEMKLLIQEDYVEMIEKQIVEGTSGKAVFSEKQNALYINIEGNVEVL